SGQRARAGCPGSPALACKTPVASGVPHGIAAKRVTWLSLLGENGLRSKVQQAIAQWAQSGPTGMRGRSRQPRNGLRPSIPLVSSSVLRSDGLPTLPAGRSGTPGGVTEDGTSRQALGVPPELGERRCNVRKSGVTVL